MPRSPGFSPICRYAEPLRQPIQFLKSIFDRNAVFETLADAGLKGVLDVLPDNKDQLVETGADRIEHRIIDDRFSGGADRIHLFESFVSAAHARRQDD